MSLDYILVACILNRQRHGTQQIQQIQSTSPVTSRSSESNNPGIACPDLGVWYLL